jgi:HSP20 family protein
MSLTRYEPWNFVSQLQDEVNRVFSNVANADSSAATAAWVPPVDINELKDRFELFVDLPGVDTDKVEITLEEGVLTIAGERVDTTSRRDNDEVVRTRMERGNGRFYRRFILPDTADANGVTAAGRNGVLEISIPKQAKALPKRIKVAA